MTESIIRTPNEVLGPLNEIEVRNALSRDGNFVEEYNGPGALVWRLVAHKPRPKNGQYPVSLPKLRQLMNHVAPSERLLRKSDRLILE